MTDNQVVWLTPGVLRPAQAELDQLIANRPHHRRGDQRPPRGEGDSGKTAATTPPANSRVRKRHASASFRSAQHRQSR